MTISTVSREDVVLSVGDTTYYHKILAKQDGYGPQGKGRANATWSISDSTVLGWSWEFGI